MEDSAVAAEFTYSVTWRETDTPYEKRMDKYRRYSFLPQHLEVSFNYFPQTFSTQQVEYKYWRAVITGASHWPL